MGITLLVLTCRCFPCLAKKVCENTVERLSETSPVWQGNSTLIRIYELGGKVPSERLIGKSPEYIEVYTATYKRNIGIQRARSAAVGSAMLQGLLLVLAIRDI